MNLRSSKSDLRLLILNFDGKTVFLIELPKWSKDLESTLKLYLDNTETLFGYFDKGNKGKLTSSEFFKALEKVGIAELTGEEKERLLRAIDFNNDGFVDISEFKWKLSWAGVWARTNEEQLIYVINDAIERANLDLADAFWLID